MSKNFRKTAFSEESRYCKLKISSKGFYIIKFWGPCLCLNLSSCLLKVFHIFQACNFSREILISRKKKNRKCIKKFKTVLAQVTPSIFFLVLSSCHGLKECFN